MMIQALKMLSVNRQNKFEQKRKTNLIYDKNLIQDLDKKLEKQNVL